MPAKVDTPAILTLSKFVWPSTSKSLAKVELPEELIVNLFALLVVSLTIKDPLLFCIAKSELLLLSTRNICGAILLISIFVFA